MLGKLVARRFKGSHNRLSPLDQKVICFPLDVKILSKGVDKLGNIVAETLLRVQMFLCSATRETYTGNNVSATIFNFLV